MSNNELIEKIRQMSEYLNDDDIAAALRMPAETVHDILAGNIGRIDESKVENQTILEVMSNPVYRQRVISVWRGAGGVGCTSVALHLAFALEQTMRTILIDLSPAAGGSDLGYYLRQSEYPNLDNYFKQGSLDSAAIQVERGLWVLLPPVAVTVDKAMVSRLIIEARREYDVILLDLPNNDADYVQEAIACSNALIMVVRGQEQEVYRALSRKNQTQKELSVLVANGGFCGGVLAREFAEVINIPTDKDLAGRMEGGIFFKRGSPLTMGAEKIRSTIFGVRSQKGAGIGKVMKMLLGS